MPLILYNACTTIDNHGAARYRITKFADGEVESSYLCTPTECECPAGVRPSCRHRQMLPLMIGYGLVNLHLFLDWNSRGIVDFEGNPTPIPSSLAAEGPSTSAINGEIQGPDFIRTQEEFERQVFAKDVTPATPATPTPPTPATFRRRI